MGRIIKFVNGICEDASSLLPKGQSGKLDV